MCFTGKICKTAHKQNVRDECSLLYTVLCAGEKTNGQLMPALGIPVSVKQQRLSRSKYEQISTYSEKEESKNHTGRKRGSRFFLLIITTDFLRHIDKGKIV